MIESLRTGLVVAGVLPAQIHREMFGVAAGAGLAGLTIRVNQQGAQQCVENRGEPTLLAALEANGIDVPSECVPEAVVCVKFAWNTAMSNGWSSRIIGLRRRIYFRACARPGTR